MKLAVGPSTQAVAGFTCQLHPAAPQLNQQLLLVHGDVAVTERVTLAYGPSKAKLPVPPFLSKAGGY